MQSSSVVFPEPEGPKRMVNPGAAVKSTSRVKSRSLAGKLLRIRALKLEWAEFCASGVGIESDVSAQDTLFAALLDRRRSKAF
jgi:hypothetical protein